MTQTVGTLAGAVWNALNENGAMASKDVKKAAGLKSDKELYLAMGWLLRERQGALPGYGLAASRGQTERCRG